jgi:hypothetical protein
MLLALHTRNQGSADSLSNRPPCARGLPCRRHAASRSASVSAKPSGSSPPEPCPAPNQPDHRHERSDRGRGRRRHRRRRDRGQVREGDRRAGVWNRSFGELSACLTAVPPTSLPLSALARLPRGSVWGDWWEGGGNDRWGYGWRCGRTRRRLRVNPVIPEEERDDECSRFGRRPYSRPCIESVPRRLNEVCDIRWGQWLCYVVICFVSRVLEQRKGGCNGSKVGAERNNIGQAEFRTCAADDYISDMIGRLPHAPVVETAPDEDPGLNARKKV